MIAAEEGHVDMLRLLVQLEERCHPAPPPSELYPNMAAYHLNRQKGEKGRHCLFYATKSKTSAPVRYLVEEMQAFTLSPSIPLDQDDSGDTVIDVALDWVDMLKYRNTENQCDDTATLKYLIEKSGRDINKPLVDTRPVRPKHTHDFTYN